MSMLYIMVPVTLALAITALIAYIWAVRNGQFDDPESQAYRMLFEDEPVRRNPPDHDSSPDETP
ncbi:cbb3-type cytochrome oxidase assembly protein CcoS [Aeoliella sp. ICT_H6.2]|uniref:Cbb3-type cytochrome oxidase assembly protein CcoS n=1 Tax=Aeoliella straminimaris TaxID=2954799 RepID=A0A9X2JJK9_9BACT|nr:cbb3-type cytochrome oxidase assembly protein CcoS [Aeoliella straminimaris]MCO6048026.1 cbb3-type cytochrome oxidase assembly protein CcoS [Aeoliella straminimaris]